jgi:hypothetical protein
MRPVEVLTTILIILLTVPACLEDPEPRQGAGKTAVDGPPVTRSQVVRTADRYARAHWTMKPENRTGVTCEGTFVSNYPVGDRIGVGYKWGGWTELDEFLDKISRGWATGTGGGVTYEWILFDCVVGVSCTGLVSRAWHLDNKYTLNYDDPDIPRKFEEITHVIEGVDLDAREIGGMKKGDAFINKHHVMLFVYETFNGMLMIIDSSYEGVRFRLVSYYELASGRYVPIRYNNIVDDIDPSGTVSNPIVLPARHKIVSADGNTRDVVSIAFHSYSIAPSQLRTGPEVVYAIDLKEDGIIEASIDGLRHEGIDNDIFLLRSLDRDEYGMAIDCVARGDYGIEAAAATGRWYIVIDSRDTSPGEYSLEVRVSPAPADIVQID